MSIPSSFWLTLLQIVVLAGLVCLGSANVQQNTCEDSSSILYTPLCSTDGARHIIAREQLLKSLARNSGKWNKKHPRWQVLEALHGYDKYEKIVGAEIDRFENLYRHVPKKHKKVCRCYKSDLNPISHTCARSSNPQSTTRTTSKKPDPC